MSYEFTVDDISHLYEVFRKADKNNDRILSRDEILALLQEEIENASDKEVDWVLGMIDIPPGTNPVSINFSQFVKAMAEFGKIGSKKEFHCKFDVRSSKVNPLKAAKLLTWNEVDRVFSQFVKADANNSGTLSLSEMCPVFEKVVPELPESSYATEFNQIDTNKSGYVDFIEFLRWISDTNAKVSLRGSRRKKLVKSSSKKNVLVKGRSHSLAIKLPPASVTDNLRANAFKAFSAMDVDKNGQLSEKEFTGALAQVLGFNLTNSEINRLYYVVDSDHSGSITFDEFLYAVAHSAEVSRLASSLKTEYTPKFDWEIPHEELQFGPKIGEGTFGVVYKGKWHGTPVAIKKLKFSKVTQAVLEDFRQEVAVMAKLRHPNIVLFMGACTNPPNLCIVTEFLEGGSLYSLLHQRKPPKKLSKHTVSRIALQSARGLNYLHQIGIVHRDMKSLNLLLDENYVCKLCDFGLSCMKPKPNEPLLNQQVGSPLWMAPELLKNSSYTEKVDVYSYAMCLWELETHKVPFEELEFDALVKAVNQGKRPEIPHSTPQTLSELMKRCWDTSPEKRPNFSVVVDLLEQLEAQSK